MKITQRMIDQARMIAEAKVGQQLQYQFLDDGWKDVKEKAAFMFDCGNYAYRLKPEPRTLFVNEYKGNGEGFPSAETAVANASRCATRIAVEYREVIK